MDDGHARELLSRERARIERALEELAPPDSEAAPDAFEGSDAGRDLLDAEIDEGLGERLQQELAAVSRAEQRLAEGTYGRSLDSDEPIPDARLEAVPWAERTTEEQAALDG